MNWLSARQMPSLLYYHSGPRGSNFFFTLKNSGYMFIKLNSKCCGSPLKCVVCASRFWVNAQHLQCTCCLLLSHLANDLDLADPVMFCRTVYLEVGYPSLSPVDAAPSKWPKSHRGKILSSLSTLCSFQTWYFPSLGRHKISFSR